MSREVWKKIKGYDDYFVSNKGRVRSDRYNRTAYLKLNDNGGGYLYMTISVNGVRKNCTVHRLVAKAFIPNPCNKLTVNHKDLNKQNNHVSNLEWATQQENNAHAKANGVNLNPSAKLSEKQVLLIRKLYAAGYATQAELSLLTGIHKGNISAIILRKVWCSI